MSEYGMDYQPIVKTFGHGGIVLTAYPSSGRIRVEAKGENIVMDWSELFAFADLLRAPQRVEGLPHD